MVYLVILTTSYGDDILFFVDIADAEEAGHPEKNISAMAPV
jgi:hypothetical protein